MADITRLSRLLNGVQRQVDLSANTLVMDNLKLKLGTAFEVSFSGTPTANRTISMPDANVDLGAIATNTSHSSGDGSDHADVASNSSFITALGSTANGDGASTVSIEDASSQFTSTNVEGALDEALDAAQAAQADADTAQGDIDAHKDGGANKHDASEIDFEETAAAPNVAAGSVEAAISDLGNAIGDRSGFTAGTDYLTNDDDVATALDKLDAQIKANADAVSAATSPMNYKGDLDASAIGSQLDDAALGDYFLVTVAGTLFGTNPISLSVGDHLVTKTAITGTPDDGADWTKVDNTESADILRSGDLASAEIFVGSAGGAATAVSMSGEASISNAGAVTLDNDSVIGKLLTGYSAGAGAVAASDSILAAIQKLDGNIQALDSSADFSHTQAATGNWTVADGSTIAAHLDELASRAATIEAWDSGDLNHTQGDAADWTVADGSSIAAHLDEAGDRLAALESQGGNESVLESFDAGETLTAGVRFVRMRKAADAGGTDGRIHLADKDASGADDFYAVGILVAAGETAGTSVSITKAGKLTATAHGLTVGEPFYLSASGAATSTAPSAADEAVVKGGIVRDANTLEIQIQVMGVN